MKEWVTLSGEADWNSVAADALRFAEQRSR